MELYIRNAESQVKGSLKKRSLISFLKSHPAFYVSYFLYYYYYYQYWYYIYSSLILDLYHRSIVHGDLKPQNILIGSDHRFSYILRYSISQFHISICVNYLLSCNGVA